MPQANYQSSWTACGFRLTLLLSCMKFFWRMLLEGSKELVYRPHLLPLCFQVLEVGDEGGVQGTLSAC